MQDQVTTGWESLSGHIALFIPLLLVALRRGQPSFKPVALVLSSYLLLFMGAFYSLAETYTHREISFWSKTEIGFMDPTGYYTFEPEFVGEGNYHAVLLLTPVVAFFLLHQVDKRRKTAWLVYALLTYPGFLYASYSAFARPGMFYVDTHKPETYVAQTERVAGP